MNDIIHHPIGIIHTPHTRAEETPVQPVYALGIPGTVEVFPEYEEGLRDVEGFSYVYLVYSFDRARPPKLTVTPYMEDVERGVFATRAPHRPNAIGLSIVRVIGREGRMLKVEDVDILDGTPLLDIKPYSSRFDAREGAASGWLDAVDEEAAQRRGRREYTGADGRTEAGSDTAPPLYKHLMVALARPEVWSRYTADTLWTDPHIATQMLHFHLNPDTELASRPPDFIERSVNWIIERFGVGEGTRVLDLGCGPGLYATPLAKTGAAVTGVDFSENSLKHARATAEREGLSIEYVHADYLEYLPAGRFDLITFIYWDLAPLSPDQRASLLKRCPDALSPDGAMVLDVPSYNYFASVVEGTSIEHSEYVGFWSPEEHFVIKATHAYESEHVSLDKYTLVEPNRTRQIYNWLQTFTPESLERELNEAGLEVVELLGDVAGAPHAPDSIQFAVIARSRL